MMVMMFTRISIVMLVTALHRFIRWRKTADASCAQTNCYVQEQTSFLFYKAKQVSTMPLEGPLVFALGVGGLIKFWTCREHSFDLIWTLSLEVWKPSWGFHACQIPMAPTMWTLWFCIWYIFSHGFWFPSSTVSLFYFFLVSSHWVDSEDHTTITARAYSSDTLCRRALERVSWLFWIFHVACLTPESFACFPD